MLAAFYNGFPLVYSDTSTYLASGFELETPVDRPITYGLFLRLTSLNGFSLWGTIFFQSLLLAYLVFKLFVVLNISGPLQKTVLALAVCTLASGVSWVTSQLIADVFTPMLILVWMLIFLDKHPSRRNTFLYYFLLFFVTAMHMSHLMITCGFLAVILLMRINKKVREFIPLAKVGYVFLFSAMTFLIFASSYSKYKNVFFVGKLEGSGILKEILDENCSDHHFKLCMYKDSLPHNTNEFIWNEESPLKKIGGYKGGKQELKEISSLATGNAKYLEKIIAMAAKDSWRQLYTFNIGDGNGVFMQGTRLYERIGRYIPNDVSMYAKSRQQQGKLSGVTVIALYFITTICIAILLCSWLVWKMKKKTLVILTAPVSGIILNAIACGSWSEVADRYQCRVMWLLILLPLILYYRKSSPAEKSI
jgi:hypothetical protein